MSDYDFPDFTRIYRGNIDPKVMTVLNEITKPPLDWSFQKFKNSLVAMAIVSGDSRHYIPAYHRPDSIEIGPLRKYIEEIRELTNEMGVEFGRTFFVDVEANQLIAGKRSEGTQSQVRMNWDKPGNNDNLRRLASVHGHPISPGAISHGMSAPDYSNFVTDRSEMFKIITWGEFTMIALKTSATPNGMNPDRVREKINELEKEAFTNSKVPIANIVDFNRLVCLEFGMTLYLVDKTNKNLAKRVNVA